MAEFQLPACTDANTTVEYWGSLSRPCETCAYTGYFHYKTNCYNLDKLEITITPEGGSATTYSTPAIGYYQGEIGGLSTGNYVAVIKFIKGGVVGITRNCPFSVPSAPGVVAPAPAVSVKKKGGN